MIIAAPREKDIVSERHGNRAGIKVGPPLSDGDVPRRGRSEDRKKQSKKGEQPEMQAPFISPDHEMSIRTGTETAPFVTKWPRPDVPQKQAGIDNVGVSKAQAFLPK